jgi:hypothetical protein
MSLGLLLSIGWRIDEFGGRATGLSGKDVFIARRLPEQKLDSGEMLDIGFVGEAAGMTTAAILKAIAGNSAAGIGTNGSALTTNFFQMCGSDGTNCRALATNAAVMMPVGVKIQFAKLDFNTVNGLLAIIEKADQQMTKILLGQVMSSGTSSGQTHKGGGQSGGGSGGGSGRGGSQLQEQTLNMYLEYIGADIAENPFAELIKEIVDANYEGVTRYPTFKFKPLSDDDQTPKVALWIQAAAVMVGGAPMYANKNIIENAVNSKDHTTLVAAVKAAGGALEAAGANAAGVLIIQSR